MNRRFFLRKRVLIPLTSGVGLIVLAWFVLLPWVVRGRVRAVLHQLNLGDATFRVTRATPWTSTVRNIDAGDGNRIDALRVTYSVEGLWNRRVDNIHVEGLQLTAEVRDGRATIEPLDAILEKGPTPATRAATQPAAPEAASSARDWPFRSVRVEESRVIVRTPQRSIVLPLKATLRWPQLRAEVAGVTIEGAIGDPKALDVRFDGKSVRGDDLTAVLRALVPEVPVSIAGDVQLDGKLTRTGPRTTFAANAVASAASAEPARSATKIAGTNVELEKGVFHVEGTFDGPRRSLRVNAKDVSLAEASVGAKATGVSADVLFDKPSAQPAAKPTQVVRVAKFTASKVDLTDGVVRFAFAPDGKLDVHEARANFLGGALSAQDVRLAPEQPVAVTLRVDNVDLGALLKLLAQGKATGEGKVSGRLPLVFANGGVQLGEGAAEASAGGHLSITDVATLESIAGGVGAGKPRDVTHAPQAQVRQNIVSALKDFQYDSLTARLVNDPQHGLVAYVHMVGKGRSGARQALEYDLRVTGLNDLLRVLVGLQRTVAREAAKP